MPLRAGFITLVSLSILSLWAAPAAAQSLFVSVGAFGNIQELGSSSSQSPTVFDDNISDTTFGFDVAVGGRLATHVVAQFEAAFPESISKSIPSARYLPPFNPGPYTSVRQVDYRTRHGSGLIGYQTTPKHGVSAVVLGGLMFVQEQTHTTTTISPIVPSNPLPTETTTTAYHMAPVLGIDVPISTIAHLAVVPQARIYKLDTLQGALGMWPGVSVRWTF